ncbi:MAG TPA: NADH-quinone oxidoreductase subunit NuoG [Solirubrobacteraceae bacterium]|nr:NADH-quinone oxidoreductase subunit NuoG [Solirubrobacteraceae bacterium]
MPRPEQRVITFTIDGREVQAPENAMLVDAAKRGDVEIPVFCYEPKLGQPVGACRMCLVEIEGIPKLQTGCSTPVKDGMVVHTSSERVKEAQQAVVEFLLVNHPLDCPVCDKGGECPLQDITFGWGPGISRFVEPKRHFVKPLELSPTIAIDRERCILCYRCVRFSQEISEDHQLVLLERGAHSYVSTFDGHPYVAPFSGNIVELCPVGALTSQPYRFKARPWDVEDAGTVCTLCPAQCNVTLTVRDERVLRVQAREHPEVDDGWLCDRGRFAYPGAHSSKGWVGGPERVTEPLLRDGGELRPVSWERALEEAAAGLKRAGARTGALVGGEATNEEGFLLARLMREGLGSPHLDSRRAGMLALELHRALSDPRLQAKVSDLEFAHAVLVLAADPIADAPILDLRLRKGVRRHGTKLVQATAEDLRERAGELAARLRDAGEEIVILWGERLTSGPRGEAAAEALLRLADTLSLADTAGAGLLEIPAGTNGRGLREAGVLPNANPGLCETSDPRLRRVCPTGAASCGEDARERVSPQESPLDAHGMAQGLAEDELTALLLLQVDPLPDLPDGELWARALERAATVVAHATFLTDGVRAHANVVFPAQAYAEKEGTIVHPDGRIQRLRPAVAHPGSTRAQWLLLADLAARIGLDLEVRTASMASRQLFDAVPFYAGLTLEEIGGKGVRWQERPAASAYRQIEENV